MMKKILVPIDGSESSKMSLKTALELGGQFQAKLLILTVVPEVSYFEQYPTDFPYGQGIVKANEAKAKGLLAQVQEEVDYDGELETYFLSGSPAKEIVNFAEEQDVDLIVIGNRGLGAFSRTLLGSVSNKVINQSSKSVLVVKNDLE